MNYDINDQMNGGIKTEVETMETISKSKEKQSGSYFTVPAMFVAGFVILFGGLLATGTLPRLKQRAELTALSKDAAAELQIVNVMTPERASSTSDLTLPGTVEAITETPIYARTNGYLRRRFVDIGDRVGRGQLLAEIESPEVDQELKQSQANTQQAQAEVEQAKADAEQARTQLELARVNLKRSQTLVAQGVSPEQETDDAQATFNARQAAYNASIATIGAREAAVGANRANVNRLVELQSFEQIRAPFDGVITLRSVDNGALVTSGSTTTSRELFRLAQSNVVRIRINVPQTYVASIKKGQPVRIEIREMPGQVFTAAVARTTNSLDTSTRTLQTEIDLPNADGRLLPGMYAQVSFTVGQENPPLIVPASALIVSSDGTQLATVDKENKIHFRKVGVGRDLGSELEIISGYAGEELLVINPNDDLREDTVVKPVAPQLHQ